MVSIQKWKCSWSLIATIFSVVALVSIVHLFLFPVVPFFDYFSVRQVQNSCVPINGSVDGRTGHVPENLQPSLDLEHRFPADLHGAVVYHNAPWKAEIGRWLSGCDSAVEEVNVVEVIRVMSSNSLNGFLLLLVSVLEFKLVSDSISV